MSRISIVECDGISELSELITGYSFKPFSQYNLFDPDVINEAFFTDIQKTAASPENHIIIEKEDNRPVAMCIARKAVIESEVFCKPVFAISHLISEGSYQDSMSRKQRLLRYFIDLFLNGNGMVSCRASSEDLSSIHALEKMRYHYMDCLVTYSFDLKQLQSLQKARQYPVRPVKKDDVDILKKIVRDSQFMDRFHNDPHIFREDSNRLYETFIENAIHGKGADFVFVAECEGTVAGFNTIENSNSHYSSHGIKIGTFILNAVAPQYRNRGVYSSLISESLLYLKDRADLAEIRTHAGNSPIHRALPRLGFRISQSQLTFHAWNTSTVSKQ
jgi:RimJ/RimL family protein N-acetyltransferase